MSLKKGLYYLAIFTALSLTSATLAADDEKAEPSAKEKTAAEDSSSTKEDASKRLEEILKNAAQSGLVTLKNDPAKDVTNSTSDPEGAAVATDGPVNLMADNMSTVTAEVPAEPPSNFTCDNGEVFNFAFAESKVTYDDIFNLRSNLVGANSGYDEEVGLQLAKTYLALALSEEALAMSSVLKSEQAQIANVMGNVLLDNTEGAASVLEPYLACTKNVGPWLALALIGADPLKSMQYTDEYSDAIEDLPKDLQLYFATQLGILAVEQGSNQLASKMLRLAEAADENDDTGVLYLKSQVDLNAGLEEGISALKQIAQVQGPLQAKALVKLGDISESKPYRDYDKDLDLISVQFNGLNEGDLATVMNIRFLAENGKYQKAINETGKSLPNGSDARLKARDSIGAILLAHLGSDESTKRHKALYGYSNNINFFRGFPEEKVLRFSGMKVAQELELPRLVFTISDGFDFLEMQQDVDLIIASSALQEGNAKTAFAIARQYPGFRQFDLISVDAAVKLKDSQTALSILDRQPNTKDTMERRATTAWRFGLWEKARDYYAELLLTDNSPENAERHRLAAYMSGEEGGFFALPTLDEYTEIENILESYEKEKTLLKGYLNNG